MYNAIADTLRQITEWAYATWRLLPGLPQLVEPLPLQTTVNRYTRLEKVNSATFATPFDGLKAALNFDFNEPIIVEGEPGAGKTSVFRWAAYRFASDFLTRRQPGYAPVFVDLGQVGR